MRRTGVILFLVTSSFAALAQVVTDSTGLVKKRNANYFFNLQVGMMAGCRECKMGKEISFSTWMIHGATLMDRLRIGGGIGFDTYFEWQTMPMFASVSYDLFGKKNRVFAQVDYGWSGAWRTFHEREYGFSSADGGQIFSAALGYRIKYGDLRLALTAGYKIQHVTAHYSYNYYSWFAINDMYSNQTTEERLKRITMTLSVGWK